MSTYIPNQDFNQQIPVQDVVPDRWDDAKSAITERFRKLANAINIRPVGWELDTPIVTGKKYIPKTGSIEYREITRFTKEIGPLPNNTTKTVAHGLTNVDATFLLLSMWGGATDTTNFTSIPIPYASVSGNPVEIRMDATNFIITTNTDYSGYDHAVVIIEYTYNS